MRPVTTFLFVLIYFVATADCLSATESELIAFTEPEKAGIDYELQGEYVGELDSENGNQKIAIQVVALGNQKFRAIAYLGGLPGDGWSHGDEKYSGEGDRKNGQIQFHPERPDASANTTAVLRDGRLTIWQDEETIAELKKIERKSPTLGAQPPQGAVVLFDGRNTEAWTNGKLVEKNLLGPANTSSKQKFGDHLLHVEFQTPFMPTSRGQGRGNSGVYIQSRYECQVLDSFGLEGEDNECGGIYSIARPTVNMCFPPLSWQTYDIDFTAARYDKHGDKTANARVTIKHNGVVIHEDLELPHGRYNQKLWMRS